MVKNNTNIFRLQCEPRSCVSREDRHTRLIEYDDRMRQEEKKYRRLLMELNKSRWVTRHVLTCGGLDQSSQHKNDELNDFAKYAVDQPMDEDLSPDLEVTRLTGDEILYGSDLTMDQIILKKKKPSVSHVDGRIDRNSTQNAMMFQSTISLQEGNDTRCARIEMIQPVCCDKLESNGRESFPLESVMIESVGLALQYWRGVCYFSSSKHYSWNKDDIDVA